MWLLVGFWNCWIGRKRTRYVITNKRVVKRSGIFGTETDDISINDIRQVRTSSSWRGESHGVGDVVLFDTHSHHNEESDLELTGVPNYEKVASAIRSQAK